MATSNLIKTELQRISIFCSVLDDAAVGISLCDPQGYFVDANRTFRRMTGYNRSQLAAFRFRSITHHEDVGENMQLVQRLYDHEIPAIVYQKRYVRHDGGVVWVRNTTSLVHTDAGAAFGTLCISEFLGVCRPIETVAQPGRLGRSAFHEAGEMPKEGCCSRYRSSQRLATIVAILTRLERLDLSISEYRDELLTVVNLAIECARDVNEAKCEPDEVFTAAVPLTSRERQVMRLIVQGNSNKQVAGILEVSVRTVETHRANIMKKLRIHSLSKLVRYAIRNRIVED